MAGRTKSTITLGLHGGGRNLLEQAQAIMYRAWETPGRKRREALAQKALQVSLDCADAYVLLAEESTSLEQALELYRKGVEAGEHALGKQTFKNDVGYFWGLLETRPYMRARAGLAQSLWEAGRHDEALAHYHDLLRLNHNDDQGLRYVLASGLLELGRDEQVADLLNAYPDDDAAAWPWTGALLAFRQQGYCSDSRGKLAAAALESNPHVPAYLLGRKKLPRRLPDSVGFGDDSEAVCYVAENLNVWQKTPEALAWLAASIKAEQLTLLQ